MKSFLKYFLFPISVFFISLCILPMTYNAYSTILKILCQNNDQLADAYQIPRSNLKRWKKKDFSPVVGIDLYQALDQLAGKLEHLIQYPKAISALNRFIKILLAYIRIQKAIIKSLEAVIRFKKNTELAKDQTKKIFARCFLRVKKTLGIERVAKFLAIPLKPSANGLNSSIINVMTPYSINASGSGRINYPGRKS